MAVMQSHSCSSSLPLERASGGGAEHWWARNGRTGTCRGSTLTEGGAAATEKAQGEDPKALLYRRLLQGLQMGSFCWLTAAVGWRAEEAEGDRVVSWR